MQRSKEERATDFARTKELQELSNGGGRLLRALDDTLWDIWYSGNADEMADLAEKAVNDFRDAYLLWTNAFVAEFMSGEERTLPYGNDLSKAFAEYLAESETRSIESMAMDTVFTTAELKLLQRGRTIANREKLSELPEAIGAAHKAVRNTAVETLFSELRDGLSQAESKRIMSLLKPADEPLDESGLASVLTDLNEFRKTLKPKIGE